MTLNPKITKLYEETRRLMDAGETLASAVNKTGISLGSYYHRHDKTKTPKKTALTVFSGSSSGTVAATTKKQKSKNVTSNLADGFVIITTPAQLSTVLASLR